VLASLCSSAVPRTGRRVDGGGTAYCQGTTRPAVLSPAGCTSDAGFPAKALFSKIL